MKLLFWLPPSAAEFIYTVILKPRPLRAMAQWVIKRMIPPRIRVHDLDLALNQDDAVVSGALTLGCYERYEITVFQDLLKPGMHVLDVGSNIGLYSAVAAKHIGQGGRVVAVEPDKRNCELIHETIKLNSFTNITVVQKAASDKTQTGRLFLCHNNKADHRIYGSEDQRRTVPVEMTTLDDLVTAENLGRIDVMKMDIQGAEALAFDGARKLLTTNAAIRIIMEFWPWGIVQAGGDPARLLRNIRDLGFHVYELDSDAGRPKLVTDDQELASRDLERQHMNLLLQREPLDEAGLSLLTHRS